MQGPPPLRIGRRTVRPAVWLPLLGALVLALVAGLASAASGPGAPKAQASQVSFPGEPNLFGSSPTAQSPEASPASSTPPADPAPAAPSRAAVLRPDGVYFGISTPKGPDAAETEAVAEAAGERPTVQEFFVKWDEEFSAETVRNSYVLGAVPLLTWEPWAGPEAGLDQADYALRRITEGRHDAYVRRFALAVKHEGQPVVLRFAHEMNADWYPWSERRSGNKSGDYIAAWRHVHDVFQELGVANVIWLWCPNIDRGTSEDDLAHWFPGNAYVDWLGMDAYDENENTAGELLDRTYHELASLSDKPVFIGETGAKPSRHKAQWTAGFFRWLADRPRVIGFSWFQHSALQGGRYDWRFTSTDGTQRAFRGGLRAIRPVPWPVA